MTDPYEHLQRPAAASATTAEVSEPRRHIREHYDAITAARGRHVTWPQITARMTELGIRASGGSVLDWRLVKSFYHAERYARGSKPKRRKPRVAVAPQDVVPPLAPPDVAPPAPGPPPPAADPAAAPGQPEASGGPFATGDAALDRALNSVRTLKPLPPSDLPGGWRGRTKSTKEGGGDGD